VNNRRAILEQMQRVLAQTRRDRRPCAIAIFDVDFFKRVNDTWGHPVGDEVLKWVTQMIGRNIRAYDTLGRYGGEEFLLLMPGTGEAGAFAIADRARLAIENEACTVDDRQIRITISAGVAITMADEEDADALLARADEALYRAKQTGRNRVIVAPAAQAGNRPVITPP
jgi:diguanylate cyclase (GGDEF)-like protein